MGMDLYAGTLTRYYAKNWKTVTQQIAEEMGYNYEIVTPTSNQNEEQASVEQIETGMKGFANFLASSLTPPEGESYTAWEENNEKPYFTDKPDWMAMTALVYKAAYSEYNLTPPATIDKNFDLSKDEVIKKALEDNVGRVVILANAEWFIPFKGYFNFTCNVPDGRELNLATVDLLLACLDAVNEKSWNATKEEIYSWRKTEGYTENSNESSVQNLESLAKFAFSIFYQAAEFAIENNLVVLMDY